MAGNPDQQEDNVDEQYQEEGEEEVGRGARRGLRSLPGARAHPGEPQRVAATCVSGDVCGKTQAGSERVAPEAAAVGHGREDNRITESLPSGSH